MKSVYLISAIIVATVSLSSIPAAAFAASPVAIGAGIYSDILATLNYSFE